MKTFGIFLTLFAFLLASCAKEDSANVNQDSIYTIYSLAYNKNEDRSIASATFRFGGPTGTLLELKDPASASFNGTPLLYAPVQGIHTVDLAGQVSSGTFAYTNIDGNTFTNLTATMTAIDFPVVDTIDASTSYTFSWVGEPLKTNEIISLTIDGTQQTNFEVFSTIIPGKTDLVLPVNKLGRLGGGPAKCILKREYSKLSLDQAPPEGGRQSVWYSIEKEIYIQQP